MKKNYLLLLLFCTSLCFAQINLVGIRFVEESNSFNMVKWNSSTPSIQEDYPLGITSYLLGSSIFNANASAYYFRSEFQLNSFNTANNQPTVLHDETSFNSATEIDMSNGAIHTIFPQNQIPSASNPDSPYFSVIKLNTVDNSITEIGTLTESITAIALSEGTCYNSDTADFYFVGYDSNAQLCIYRMNTETTTFSYEKIILPPEDITYSLSGLYFDMQANTILAVKTTFDIGTELTMREIVQISPINGAFTTLYTFGDLMTIQNGSTTFDQATRSYILVTIDQNFNKELLVYNTISNTVLNTTLPINVAEIEADNTNFSTQRYALSSESFIQNEVKVYPVPSKNNITVATCFNGNTVVSIIAADGKVCYRKEFNKPTIDIDLSTFTSGIYTLKLENKSSVITKKIIKE